MTDDKKREILAQVGRVNSDICYGCPIIERYLELMSAQPEIVRCKDCKHGQYEEWDNGEFVDKTVYCDGYGTHKPDWFCADGRKE